MTEEKKEALKDMAVALPNTLYWRLRELATKQKVSLKEYVSGLLENAIKLEK
jgi:predicted HicB family RNase H-like nuclease